MPSFPRSAHHRALHSFPPRRSSDLGGSHALSPRFRLRRRQRRPHHRSRTDRQSRRHDGRRRPIRRRLPLRPGARTIAWKVRPSRRQDRKSTRLNSSHMSISYAVFSSIRPPPCAALFPSTTLFRSRRLSRAQPTVPSASTPTTSTSSKPNRSPKSKTRRAPATNTPPASSTAWRTDYRLESAAVSAARSEEHTSELQSHVNLVCRLFLDPPTTVRCTLSLHDALPISAALTRSAHGSVCVDANDVHIIEAEPIAKVEDTTGAGDQYAAGFLYGLAHGLSLGKCGRLGGKIGRAHV